MKNANDKKKHGFLYRILIGTFNKGLFFQEHKHEINKINRRMMLYGSISGGLSMFVLAFVSFIMDNYGYKYHLCYAICFIFYSLMFLLTVFYLPKHEKQTLWFMYPLAFFCFMSTIVSGVILNTDSVATLFIVFLFFIPALFTDKNWRIMLLMLISAICFIIAAAIFKTGANRNDDIVNCVTVLFPAMFVNGIILDTKLHDMQSKTILKSQRDLDLLTGLFSRTKFHEKISELASNPSPVDIGGLMLDIDCFKTYNDTYGHIEGDVCLQVLGKFLLDYGEENGIEFYRYGGEEFFGIILNADERRMSEVCSEIVRGAYKLYDLEDTRLKHRITVSVGYTLITNGDKSLEKLISDSDEALFAAKNRGRNRAVRYNPQNAAKAE